jgi:hypothetical protein
MIYTIHDTMKSSVDDTKYPEDVCECLTRPIGCVCFKRKGLSYKNDGTKTDIWQTPPPSPILRNYDNIKEWGITLTDKVYLEKLDGIRMTSKSKITDYPYPHCHSMECKQYSIDLYYEIVAKRSGKNLPTPYTEEMS